MTKVLTYEEISQQSLVESLQVNGTVEISMNLRRARLCHKIVENAHYFATLNSDPSRSRPKMLWMFLSGLFYQGRALLFHSRLTEVGPFYVLSAPLEYALDVNDGGNTVLRFHKPHSTSP